MNAFHRFLSPGGAETKQDPIGREEHGPCDLGSYAAAAAAKCPEPKSRPRTAPQKTTAPVHDGSHVLHRAGMPIIVIMGLRDITRRLACFAGWHAGAWVNLADGSCVLTRTCPDCRQSWSKTQHTFTEWEYANPGDTTSCDMERHCPRCLSKEEQRGHKWRTRYLSPDRCEMQSYCTRCGETSKDLTSHDRYEWRYFFDITPPSGLAAAPLLGGIGHPGDLCRGREFCTRCGTPHGRHELRHEWGGWQPCPRAISVPVTPEGAQVPSVRIY